MDILVSVLCGICWGTALIHNCHTSYSQFGEVFSLCYTNCAYAWKSAMPTSVALGWDAMVCASQPQANITVQSNPSINVCFILSLNAQPSGFANLQVWLRSKAYLVHTSKSCLLVKWTFCDLWIRNFLILKSRRPLEVLWRWCDMLRYATRRHSLMRPVAETFSFEI